MEDEKADRFVRQIISDWRKAGLNAADQALCAYAVKITRTPERLQAKDLDELRAHGFDERALHDAVQIISYFNYINRVADALGVEVEEHLPAWEQATSDSD